MRAWIIYGYTDPVNMSEPEVTGSVAEDKGDYDDEMMTTPPKVRNRSSCVPELVVHEELINVSRG